MKVTDKTLVLVGLLAFFVSLGCVSFVLVELGGVDGITGFATTNTTYGYVNVTVLGSVAVTLVQDTVNFGSGTLSASKLYVNSSGLNTGNPNQFDTPGAFHLRNDGNVYVNVTVNGSTAVQFFGVSGQAYKYAIEDGNDGASYLTVCHNVSGGTGVNDETYAAGGIAFINTHTTVCPNMSYATGEDEFNVSIFLEITNDTVNGSYSDTLEFQIMSLEHS
jgi:hypothetical protein